MELVSTAECRWVEPAEAEYAPLGEEDEHKGDEPATPGPLVSASRTSTSTDTPEPPVPGALTKKVCGWGRSACEPTPLRLRNRA